MFTKIVFALMLLGPAHAQPEAAYAALAKGRVDVDGGVTVLAARRDGIIKDVNAEEGDKVEAGQLLATQDDREARLKFAAAEREAVLAAAQSQATAVQLASAQREFTRAQGLMEGRAIAQQALDKARDEVLRLEADLKVAKAAQAAADAKADVAAYEIEQYAIRAPQAGQIVRRFARPGDGVSTLNVTPLFWFVPAGPRIVRAELEESFVVAVNVAMAAEVTSESDRTRAVRTTVTRLSPVFLPRRPSLDDPTAAVDVRVVECVLALPADHPFLIGERVLVRILRGN